MTDGENLRRRRKQLGLSQSALAGLLGVRQATVSDWERGKVAIDHPAILDLALRALEYEKHPVSVREPHHEPHQGVKTPLPTR